MHGVVKYVLVETLLNVESFLLHGELTVAVLAAADTGRT